MPKTSRPRRTKTTAAADPGQAASSYTEIQQKKAVSDPESDRWALPSFMSETNGGGSAEQVPGFNIQRAITAGFETKRVAGPTTRARAAGRRLLFRRYARTAGAAAFGLFYGQTGKRYRNRQSGDGPRHRDDTMALHLPSRGGV